MTLSKRFPMCASIAAIVAASTIAACDDTTGDDTTSSGSTTTATSSGSASTATGSTTASSSGSGTSSSSSSSSSGTGGASPLAINGTYVDNFMSDWTIADDVITIGFGADDSKFNVAQYDNATFVVAAQNDAANTYFPNDFSRFDWTFSNTDLYVCQTAYNAPTLAAALATPAADSTDLATGCGGNPWSWLIPTP